MTITTRHLSLIALLAVGASLGACSKNPEPTTVGQKVDAAVASTERAAEKAKSDVQTAASEAKTGATQAAQAVADTARDINITAKVNAELARDPALQALRINVDTQDGKVALNGTAPSKDALDRATRLAAGVEGVVSVDNRLKVEPSKS